MTRSNSACAEAQVQRCVVDMRIEHLDAVMNIERASYATPWTRGNFVDSLASGCTALCLFDRQPEFLGYAVAMPGVEEAHLLNLTIAPNFQGRGHARYLLGQLLAGWAAGGCARAWLEVRAGNLRAQRLYHRFGFVDVGRRRGYYPPAPGAASASREDAITMCLAIPRPRQ